MKKVILIIAVVAFGFVSSFAQTNSKDDSDKTTEKFDFDNGGKKGFSALDIFASGSVAYRNTNDNNTNSKTRVFSFSPRVGYFISEDIAVGLQVNYSSSLSRRENLITADGSEFAIGGFGRYYLSPSSNFSIFAQADVNYLTTKRLVGSGNDVTDYKENGFSLNLSPGANYFLSNHFAIEVYLGLIGYESLKPKVDGADTFNTFDAGISLENLNIGLLYKF